MTAETTDAAFEADVRAMLRRRAADVVDRPDPALPTTGAAVPARGGHQPVGLAVAAAAVVLLLVAVVGVGAVKVGSGGGDHPEEVVAADRDGSTSTSERVGTTSDEWDDDGSADAATAERRSGVGTRAGSGARSSGGRRRPNADPDRPGAGPGPGSGAGSGSQADPGSGPETTDPPAPGGPSGGQAAVVVDGSDVGRWLRRHCDGSVTPTSFDLPVRLDRTGPSAGSLTVRLRISGPLAAPAPGTFTFAPGSSHGSLTLSLPARGAVELVVDVLPGDGYVAGNPSRWRFVDPDPPLRIDCLRPLVATSGSTSQTIEVGQLPAEVTFAHELPDYLTVTLDGSAPPGLTVASVLGPVLAWEGAATTPGTYVFDVHTCRGEVCDGTAHITITVLPPAVEGGDRRCCYRIR